MILTILSIALLASCQGTEKDFANGIICPADICSNICKLTDSGRILRRIYTSQNGIEGYWEVIN